jgi:hypothetical protein
MNEFLEAWETRGFSSPSMLHNLPWLTELNVDYAISTYDTDPFEPQSCQHGRIFPSSVQPPARDRNGRRFDRYPVELYTDFLDYIRERYGSEVWIARPSEVAAYWRDLQPLAPSNAIAPHQELCESCHQAHTAGWVQHYPSVTPDSTKYLLPPHPDKIPISASLPLPVLNPQMHTERRSNS